MEDREFRIFASSAGDEPVARDIIGEEELERRVEAVRSVYPNDTLYVREITENVIRVYKPGGEVIRFEE